MKSTASSKSPVGAGARTARRIAPALLALTLLAGCGSSDPAQRERALGTGGGGNFASKLQRLCYSPAPPTAESGDLRVAGRLAQDQADFRGRSLRAMKSLTAPDGLDGQFANYQGALGRVVALLRLQVDAAKRGDHAAFQRAGVQANESLATAAQLAAALKVAQCAQAVTEPGAVASPPTSSPIAAPADRLCADANRVLSVGATRSGDTSTLARQYASVRATRKKLLSDLRTLRPPDAQRRVYANFLTAFRGRLAALGSQQRAALSRQSRKLRFGQFTDENAYGLENRIAAALGMKVCGQSGTAGA